MDLEPSNWAGKKNIQYIAENTSEIIPQDLKTEVFLYIYIKTPQFFFLILF